MEKKNLLAALALSVAIIFCGAMLPLAVKSFRSFDRTVSVKGLCEREVAADKVIWPICFKNVNDDLGQLTAQMDKDKKIILDFLKKICIIIHMEKNMR